MKKSCIPFLSIIAAFLMAACTKDVTVPSDKAQTTFDFTLDATLGSLDTSDDDTKASATTVVRLSWKAGDGISVINLTTGKALGGTLTADESGTTTTFSGTLSGTVSPGDKLVFLYPSQGYEQETDYQPVTIDFSQQAGSVRDGIPICVYATKTAEGPEFREAKATFSFLMSYIQFNLAGLEKSAAIESVDVEKIGSSMTLSIASDGINAVPAVGTIHFSPSNYKVSATGTKAFYASIAESPQVTSRKVTVLTENELKSGSFTGAKLKSNGAFDTIVANFTDAPVPMNDPVFRDFCIQNFDTDGDGMISLSEARSVTSIDISRTYQIPYTTKASASSDETLYLDGIGYFSSLKELNFRENNISNWDLSRNTELEVLWCDGNQASSIDVSHNTKLKYLNCGGNLFTEIDLSKNPDLEYLDCRDTYITEIDLSNNMKLRTVDLTNYFGGLDKGNRISKLDLSGHTLLNTLMCNSCRIDDLDISGCSSLETLQCNANGISSLDLGGCTSLTSLDCSRNDNLHSLDVSRNLSLTYLDCSYCENLETLYVLDTQNIYKITENRSSNYIPDSTEIIVVESGTQN